jgi:hypothetical protein
METFFLGQLFVEAKAGQDCPQCTWFVDTDHEVVLAKPAKETTGKLEVRQATTAKKKTQLKMTWNGGSGKHKKFVPQKRGLEGKDFDGAVRFEGGPVELGADYELIMRDIEQPDGSVVHHVQVVKKV